MNLSIKRNTTPEASTSSHVWPLQAHRCSLRWPPLVSFASALHPPLQEMTSCRKIPFRLSSPQKRRQRKRLRLVDNVVATVDRTLKRNGMATAKGLERWKQEMPTEAEMRAKDKYTMFDRKEKKYRKGVHSEFTHPS